MWSHVPYCIHGPALSVFSHTKWREDVCAAFPTISLNINDAGGGFPPARCSWREGCAPTPARASRLTPPSQPHTGPPRRHRRFSSRSRAPLAPPPPPR
ncbi:hypothetical protein O3P69_007340 [Scylla paramamosain]|uniref:Uncharacterized protein n=1 Tax=Scylla paramamosain TaxID=85552 RepID=A0AAW0V2X0_SCYPA